MTDRETSEEGPFFVSFRISEMKVMYGIDSERGRDKGNGIKSDSVENGVSILSEKGRQRRGKDEKQKGDKS